MWYPLLVAAPSTHGQPSLSTLLPLGLRWTVDKFTMVKFAESWRKGPMLKSKYSTAIERYSGDLATFPDWSDRMMARFCRWTCTTS